MADAPETLCVHAGSLRDPHGGVNSPISMATAYTYQDADSVVYPRYYNTPNQRAVAGKIAALEQAEEALLFASGMAAISDSFFALLQAGDHIIYTQGCYGGTAHYIAHELPRLHISATECALDTAAIAQAMQPNTRLIYVETPSNPLLDIIDLSAVAELARDHQAISVADNTFATPLGQQPLTLGFDLVVHSATKYLGGHSDLSAGVVAGRQALIAQIHQQAVRHGGCLNALDSWLLERSLKTLAVRVERQASNAFIVAQALTRTDGIHAVYYPGLESHPKHAIARQQMRWYGGMLSFELSPAINPSHFESALQLIRPAVSLGGVETTTCRPCLTSHAKMSVEKRQALGITDGLMRLSVGVEHADDLIRDIRQAVSVASATHAA